MTERSQDSEFEFKINGVEVKTPHRILTAGDILELAAKHGAIPRKPEQYTLEGDKGTYNWDDKVDLEEDNIFRTIPNTPPPAV